MHIFTFNLTFIFIFISFCCPIAIGSSPPGTEHSALAKDFKQNPTDITEKDGSLTIEEIFSPKKILKKYLENVKGKALHEKSPDRGHRQIVAGKEAYSTDGEMDASPTTSAHGHPATPVAGEQSIVGEEGETQMPAVGDISLLSVSEEKTPPPTAAVKEKITQEELSVVEGYRSAVTDEEIPADNLKTDVHSISTMSGSETATASFSESLQKAKDEGIPMTIATPELHNETIAGGEPLTEDAKETQTLDLENESRLTTDENRMPFTSEGEIPDTPDTEGTIILNTDETETEKGLSSPETTAESVKDSEKSKPIWDIWHRDPTHNVILAVVITLIAAKVAEWMARRLRLPAVVGTLIIGMLLGNVFTFTGWDFFNFLRTMPFLKMVSYFGTLILLFTAGLHTDIRALLRVGVSSFLVCIGGIIVPAWFGLMVGHFLLPDASTGTKLLIAIILCNTGMGLLMAVLGELKLINTPEGRILTGAAVITEIIVILTFGLVSGFVVRGGASVPHILVTIGIAISFLAIILVTILRYGERFGNFLTKRVTEGLNIPIVVISALLLAFMSGSIGLHTVIGAFVAGLLLRNVKLKDSAEVEYGAVERIIRPYYSILVPILFVRVGAQVELESFLNLNAVILGLAITGAAIIGKMFCSVCPIEKGVNRLIIGIGMAMKLEGTLILSGIGRDMGILDDVVFSSIIMVIVFTSVLCPSFLKVSLTRRKRRLTKNFHVTVDENTKEIYLRFKSEVQR